MYEHTLHFNDKVFEPMVADGEQALQLLLQNMIEKGSKESSLTIKLDILMEEQFIETDPLDGKNTRRVLMPRIFHKVSTVMQIKDERKGIYSDPESELVWDAVMREYVLKPITGRAQQSLFENED